MKQKNEEPLDMTRGQYRRQYAGYVRGRRINAVSLMAEAWFWRINVIFDDFGNGDADPVLLHAATVGRRAGVSPEDVSKWVDELVGKELLARYSVNGDDYLHIVGFTDLQPGGKNGKRVHRFPASPWDIGGNGPDIAAGDVAGERLDDSPGESGGIQVNPEMAGQSKPHHYKDKDKDNHQDKDNEKPAAQASGEPRSATSPAAGRSSASPMVLEFETVGGRKNKANTWALTEAYVAEMGGAFPGVDVVAECRKALGWTRAKPANRKTADGMREFLWKWMTRAQNDSARNNGAQRRGGPAVTGAVVSRPNVVDRARQLLEAR